MTGEEPSAFERSIDSVAYPPIELPRGYRSFVAVLAASKGGTGKSTLASNLAVTAACQGLRTLVIDSDIDHDQQTCVE